VSSASIEARSFQLEAPAEPGRVIRGRVESPEGAEHAGRELPHVIVLHGFKGFMGWGFFPLLSARLASEGFVAVSFNFSGSGIGADLERFTDLEGFRQSTPTRELEDVALVRRFVATAVPWADPARVGVFGHSRGGATALLHAAEAADVGAVVTWSAVATFARFDPETVAGWRARGFLPIENARTGQTLPLGTGFLDDLERNAARLDVPDACRRLRAPALLVHGTADETVPFAEARRLHGASPPSRARLLAVEGAGHTFGATHPLRGVPAPLTRALDATLAAFRKHLAGGGVLAS
jgi:dipeptidyl aminopeptidase/acylaminoacyl peptidase